MPDKESFHHNTLKHFVSHGGFFFSPLLLPHRHTQGFTLMHGVFPVHEDLSETQVLIGTKIHTHMHTIHTPTHSTHMHSAHTHIHCHNLTHHLYHNNHFCHRELSSKSQIHKQMSTLNHF
jgi:hypothetical protein